MGKNSKEETEAGGFEQLPAWVYIRNQKTGKVDSKIVTKMEHFADAINEGWVENPADVDAATPEAEAAAETADAAAEAAKVPIPRRQRTPRPKPGK